MSRDSIFVEVAAERARQDGLFGGPEHDDAHSATDWVAILVRHVGLAVDDGSPAGICLLDNPVAGHDPARYRRQMVRVAAVAIAALETFDRKAAAAELQPLAEMAQAMADRHHETAIVVPAGHPKSDYVERQPYVTLASHADAWERQHALLMRTAKNGRVS